MTQTIKKHIPILFASALSATTGLTANVNIEWHQPERYSDLGINFHDDASLDTFSKEIEPYITRFANDHLPDGSKFELTFTNVDLASEFEPWGLNNDVRIVRSPYSPRLSFTYKIFGINGSLIDTGEKTISDHTFDFNIGRPFFYQDKYFYEKDLIASWIRNDLTVSTNKIIQKSRNNA
jgi:hypothetical protein